MSRNACFFQFLEQEVCHTVVDHTFSNNRSFFLAIKCGCIIFVVNDIYVFYICCINFFCFSFIEHLFLFHFFVLLCRFRVTDWLLFMINPLLDFILKNTKHRLIDLFFINIAKHDSA